MSEGKYLVGIDLGTSNCAVAFVDPALGAEAPVQDFPVLQLRRPGEAAPGAVLPSSIYLPGEHELAPEAARLPWREATDWIAGEFARWQGARVPGRLVTSAKSWLCHPGVDRSAPILPWGAPAEVKKLSPVDASARLLTHMSQAWDDAHPQAPLRAQEVLLTVPASFDEAARALTVTAARQAGLEHFTLIEEPQAAFYDFTSRNRHHLQSALEEVRLALVVDVGGGTSDFTLVQIGASDKGPVLRRIAVGEHLILGGDNMDAALSRNVEQRLMAAGRKLSSLQWAQLTQAARSAKEALLGGTDLAHFNISVAAEGSRLLGRTLSAQIGRAEAEQVMLEGFFPHCQADAELGKSPRVGLQELGLPYAQDAAITRHVAAFLRAHAQTAFQALGEENRPGALPRPDAILLNGGVFNSSRITARFLDAMSRWWPDQPPLRLLHHDSLDLAVARGAAYYGLVRRGLGRRISGGAAHALYVGLETADNTQSALCVIPRGQEEGQTVQVGDRVFQLALDKPVRFPLFSSASDRFEKPGQIVPISEDMHPLPPIHTLLKGQGKKPGTIPVHLRAALTEIGTLELWCVSDGGNQRWRLEFELRGAAPEPELSVTEAVPPAFAEARGSVQRVFGRTHGKNAAANADRDVKQLWAGLESALGPREQWRLAVLRELWGVLMAAAARRRRSPDFERIYFQLLGYTLRPGFGYALDQWRCEQTAVLFGQGVQFQTEKPVWKEFWILWRRIAGGLSPARHEEIWASLKPWLAIRIPPRAPKHLARPKGVQPEGIDEMVRLAAAVEHIPAAEKVELGAWILTRMRDRQTAVGPWAWALGRLGSRSPLYGSAHETVPPAVASGWVAALLQPHVVDLEGARFALAQLARLTGDRARDLDEQVRQQVLAEFRRASVSPGWERMLTEVVGLEAADRARALGDTLPVGLSVAG